MAIKHGTKESFRDIAAKECGLELSPSEAAVLLNDLVKYYRLLHQLDQKIKQASEG
ncbi:MAG: hypothetical protein H6780_00280 [Candidatus Nomurabacteria bacterium]|nr:MAG: hypothetical protein H6780_00280 [Candidatus Nomurabacteria bacterium]